MIEVSVQHIPLITYQTSGDSYFIKRIGRKLFFSIVDIAGHGTKKCFLNANKLIQIIKNKSELLDFKTIFQEMNKELHGEAAVVLIGVIDMFTAKYQYSCVGNISIRKVDSKGETETLRTQEGIVGLYLPLKIETIEGYLKDNEYLLIHTDGIKSSINLSKYFVYNKDINKILKLIVEKERNIDDALGILLRYNNE